MSAEIIDLPLVWLDDCLCGDDAISRACPDHGYRGDPAAGTEWLGEEPDEAPE